MGKTNIIKIKITTTSFITRGTKTKRETARAMCDFSRAQHNIARPPAKKACESMSITATTGQGCEFFYHHC